MSHKTINVASTRGSRSARWILIVAGVLVIVGLSVHLMLSAGEKNLHNLNEAKKSRTTTAVVKAKELVRFDDRNTSYIGDYGQTVEVAPGTEQWRVYYEVNNFDQVPEPKRSELMRSEEARIKKFGFRFYPVSTAEKAFYDNIQVGDQLEVIYRYMGDEKEIIRVRNLSHPNG